MKELESKSFSGLKMLVFWIFLFILSVTLFVLGISFSSIVSIVSGIVIMVVCVFLLPGFLILQPNEAAAMVLFGEYKGTIKKSGWHWVNPFFTKKNVSLRLRNLNGEKLKVNDEMGNPIEIAAVVVWKVANTAEALFEVQNYSEYVKIQSESAIRHLAGLYPYDNTDESHTISLKGNADEVAENLVRELQERLDKAGVVVEEARITHLAYAPEIAMAMLQRQQASAIIAARQKIVEGAVGMVQMALNKLSEDGIVDLDEERRAAMVSNLLVVLCGERSTQPIINTGTLHN